MAYPQGVDTVRLGFSDGFMYHGAGSVLSVTATVNLPVPTITHLPTGATLTDGEVIAGGTAAFDVPDPTQNGWALPAGSRIKGWTYDLAVTVTAPNKPMIRWAGSVKPRGPMDTITPGMGEITESGSVILVDGIPIATFDIDSSPGIMAPAVIIPPTSVLAPGTEATWPLANKAWFTRFTLPVARTYRYFGYRVQNASGNIQVGVVKLDGLNYTRVMHSGVIPATDGTVTRIDLGATELPAGDYALFFWADNTALTIKLGSDYKLASLQAARELDIAGGVPSSGVFTGGWGSGRYITGLTLAVD